MIIWHRREAVYYSGCESMSPLIGRPLALLYKLNYMRLFQPYLCLKYDHELVAEL